MPFPIIPLLAISALLGGTGALAWYSRLSQEEKDAADRRANELGRVHTTGARCERCEGWKSRKPNSSVSPTVYRSSG